MCRMFAFFSLMGLFIMLIAGATLVSTAIYVHRAKEQQEPAVYDAFSTRRAMKNDDLGQYARRVLSIIVVFSILLLLCIVLLTSAPQ